MLIQKLRLQQGWSQEQLADMSGVSVRTIQRLEQGKPAAIETLKSLGAVLNVPFHELRTNTMDNAEIKTDDQITQNPLPADEVLALRHVRKLRGFYVHAAQYCVVIVVLAIINYFTSDYPWVLWTAFGWGTGVLFHGLAVFNKIPFLGAEWEKRVVEERLGRKL
jgi:transcriptional regulator with XRE-family HTH domain